MSLNSVPLNSPPKHEGRASVCKNRFEVTLDVVRSAYTALYPVLVLVLFMFTWPDMSTIRWSKMVYVRYQAEAFAFAKWQVCFLSVGSVPEGVRYFGILGIRWGV